MTYGRTMRKAMAFFDIKPQNRSKLAADIVARKMACNDQMTILLALREQRIIHARNTSMHPLSFGAKSLSVLILVSRETYAPW